MSERNGASTIASGKVGVMGSGTVGGLMAFFDYLVNKGIGTAAAVTPMKSAARQIFETVEGTEDVDELDIRSLDIDEYLDRFQVKAMSTGRYKPESINAYRSRFARGMEYYSTYLTSGTVPKFKMRMARAAGPTRKRDESPKEETKATPAAPQRIVADSEADSSKSGLISYPFPLQNGGIATLRLPVRLEKTDADRLGAFIRTLVFEPQKELTTAPMDPGRD
jgi:hypothetical protein